MLNIEQLIVTQHELRYLDQISQMVKFVEMGGMWNLKALVEHANKFHPGRVSPLIQISRFPDGKDFIHDGHHRLVTTWIGNRKVIFPEEYEITEWTYELYLEINVAAGWITPFDPRTHCRKPDLHEFKDWIRANNNNEDLIRSQSDAYCEIRRFHTIPEMAETLKEK